MREQRQRQWQQWRRLEKRIRAKDELYDVSLLRGYQSKNDGYGELLPCFSKQIAEVLNLNSSHKVVDVGSGIGFLCFDLACASGCSVKGIEIRRDIYLKSVQIARHVAERMKLDVSFVYGDGTADCLHFTNMDVIVCCNTLWSDENNYRLLQKLCLQMRPGTRVVVLEQLGGQRYHARSSARSRADILSACFHLPPQKVLDLFSFAKMTYVQYTSEPESVSWTSNPIHFYVYTKKKIPRDIKERIEHDRQQSLAAPPDPHFGTLPFRGRKRANALKEGNDAELEEIEKTEQMEIQRRKRVKREETEKAKQLRAEKGEKPTKKRKRFRLTMRKRRRRPAASAITINSKIKQQAQQKQQQEKRKQVTKRGTKGKKADEEEQPARQTRAKARALLSSPTSSFSTPTPAPTTRTLRDRSFISTPSTPPSNNTKNNFGKPNTKKAVSVEPNEATNNLYNESTSNEKNTNHSNNELNQTSVPNDRPADH